MDITQKEKAPKGVFFISEKRTRLKPYVRLSSSIDCINMKCEPLEGFSFISSQITEVIQAVCYNKKKSFLVMCSYEVKDDYF
ncbi:hypothetical protein BA1_11744 [Bacillus xiamenensis]|nr:hypothetical protein BA1_11744 [Bacillus xiamenensis]